MRESRFRFASCEGSNPIGCTSDKEHEVRKDAWDLNRALSEGQYR